MSGNKYEKNKQYGEEKEEGKQFVTYAWIIQ